MSYADQAALATDVDFQSRLTAAVVKEAKGKNDQLANEALKNPVWGQQMFNPLIVSEPGFDSAYAAGGQVSIDDSMILSAIQANWTRVSEIWFTATPVALP